MPCSSATLVVRLLGDALLGTALVAPTLLVTVLLLMLLTLLATLRSLQTDTFVHGLDWQGAQLSLDWHPPEMLRMVVVSLLHAVAGSPLLAVPPSAVALVGVFVAVPVGVPVGWAIAYRF